MTTRIGILAKGGTDWLGGLYYTFNLIRALRALPKEEQPEIILLLPQQYDAARFEEIAPLAELCPVPEPAASAATINPALVRLLADKGIDVIFPCMRSMGPEFTTPWLPWVPDLQHWCHPEFFAAEECARRDREFGRIAADARLVVLSSKSARADFDRFYPGHREKLRVLHFATVPLPQWHDLDALRTVHDFKLPPRYLMLPNQFWVHKNHRVAFEAVRILNDRGLDVPLVCTGKTEDPRHPRHAPQLRRFIQDHDLAGSIHILGLLPRLAQIQLMRAAAAIVQPSLFEGWSTVVEDARVFGKRMFLSDIPVHREQQPPGAVYFPPYRSDVLADEIARDWDTLPQHPDPPYEQEALAGLPDRVTRYARGFLNIAEELIHRTAAG